MSDSSSEGLAMLILSRLSVLDSLPTPAALAKSLSRFSPTDMTPAAWQEAVGQQLEGFVRMQTYRLKPEAPANIAWRKITDKLFPAYSLGLEYRQLTDKFLARLVSRDDWAAAIVARELGVWTDGPPPRLPALCDAIAWRAMGLTSAPKRLPDEVRAHFVKQALPDATGPYDRMIRTEAARIVGAPRPDKGPLCDALVRRWVAGKAPLPPAARKPVTFVDRVRDLARAATTGVFGDRKVFIASVWDALHVDPAWAMTLADFKATLVVAHRHGEVVLARADLVGAMDPELVARSETAWDGATFHFIVREAS